MSASSGTCTNQPVRDVRAPTPLVWLIGPSDDACFAPAIAWLAARSRLHHIESFEQSLGLIKAPRESPHGIVFCSLRPGQIDIVAVEALHRAEPLARLALLLGSWCEGEVRSGQVAAGVKRVYWHQWRAALPIALGLPHADGGPQPLSLPRTANDADWLEATLRSPSPSNRDLLVVVCTTRAATFDTLSDALAGGGFRTAWRAPGRTVREPGAAVVLWDGWPDEPLGTCEAAEKSAAHLILLDFPRQEDRRKALELGAVGIVSRPFHLAELWSAVDGAASGREPSSISTGTA